MRFFGKRAAIAAAGGISTAAVVVAVAFVSHPTPPAPLPDFGRYEAGPERKSEFFAYLRPLIDSANARIRSDRDRLLSLSAGGTGWLDRRWLRALAADYAIETTSEEGAPKPDDELVEALLLRVDVVPASLALAQAAKESGWGTSRFAREGNNLFGEWCFDPGCGLVPRTRAPGRRHEVRAFDSPSASVDSYLRNLNTHSRYRSFRLARKGRRDDGIALSGTALAGELSQYSERRDEYVSEIRQLIRVNALEQPGDAAGDDTDGDGS